MHTRYHEQQLFQASFAGDALSNLLAFNICLVTPLNLLVTI